MTIALPIAVLSASSARANLVSELSFSDAEWINGGGLSGSIIYEYDTSDSLIRIDSADIFVTAGIGSPAFNLTYNVPGQTNTASQPG